MPKLIQKKAHYTRSKVKHPMALRQKTQVKHSVSAAKQKKKGSKVAKRKIIKKGNKTQLKKATKPAKKQLESKKNRKDLKKQKKTTIKRRSSRLTGQVKRRQKMDEISRNLSRELSRLSADMSAILRSPRKRRPSQKPTSINSKLTFPPVPRVEESSYEKPEKRAKRAKSGKKDKDEQVPRIKVLPPRRERPKMLARRSSSPPSLIKSEIPQKKKVTNAQRKLKKVLQITEQKYANIVVKKEQKDSSREDESSCLKTIEELERIQRGIALRCFLLEASRDEEEGWVFRVFSRESLCKVWFKEQITCNCFEFRINRSPVKICRHISFLFKNIAQNEKLLDIYKEKVESGLFGAELEGLLNKRFQPKVPDEKEMKTVTHDNECSLCLTQMNPDEEMLKQCEDCSTKCHVICVNNLRNFRAIDCTTCQKVRKASEEEEGLTKIEVKLEHLGLK